MRYFFDGKCGWTDGDDCNTLGAKRAEVKSIIFLPHVSWIHSLCIPALCYRRQKNLLSFSSFSEMATERKMQHFYYNLKDDQ